MPTVRPAAPAWTPRQLWSRIAAILATGTLVVVLHFTGVLARIQTQLFPPKIDWKNDYSVVEFLRDQIVRDGLTTDRKDCLVFIIDGNDPPDAQRMRLMERHSGTCQGPKNQLPLLFTLRVDREHRTIESDQGSPGSFHAFPH